MSASTIVGIILLLALAVWAGHDIGRALERRAWHAVIKTLLDECDAESGSGHNRGTIHAVYWRRKMRGDP